jgi:hypothetical protein
MRKLSISKAKKNAWKQFSMYIRLRDSLKTVGNTTQCKCITCGRIYPTTGKGCIQAGHFIPGRHNAVLFNEEIIFGQCYSCNIGLKGNWVEYERAMRELYGEKKVEEFKQLSKGKADLVKYTASDYLEIEEKYKKKVKEILDKQSVS